MKVTQATEHEFTSNQTSSETIVPSCRCPLYTAQSLRMYRVQTRPHLGWRVAKSNSCGAEGSAAQHHIIFSLHCLEGIFVLECLKLSLPQFWWLARTAMKLEEEGLENACGTWTLLAFYVPGAQNCIFGKTKLLAVWVVNFALTGTHGPLTSDGSRWAYCMLLHAEVACVVSEHSGGEGFSDRNVLWVQQQLDIWKGKGMKFAGKPLPVQTKSSS